MRYFITTITLVFICFHLLTGQGLIDAHANKKTKALYSNLKKISEQGLMFGHQDGDAYGVSWTGEPGRSDVKDICGDYPAVHGWDLGKSLKNEKNIDGVPFDQMLTLIKQTYKRGGITTISWHWDNPTSGGDSWDTTSAVKNILPNGSRHAIFTEHLDLLATFFKKSKTPIIFRPWHEHNGNWFWWGKGNCTEEDYKELWKFTVTYLRDIKKIHNLIYAFSPDRSQLDSLVTKESYLYGYPGDEYIDLIGLDNYIDVGIVWNQRSPEVQQASLIRSLKTIEAIATEKNKVAALTETGLEGVKNPNWFTEVILNPILQNNIKIAYVLVWRNANDTHHYAPYKGHPSEADFLKFYKNPKTLFESDLKKIYK